MKLIVDCILNSESYDLCKAGALAQLLAKGKVTQFEKPLIALICEQYGLKEAPDHAIAAISAKVDGVDMGEDVSDSYWFRANPVHLILQRDSFSLADPIPLQVACEHADSIIVSLNQHFNQDGLVFMIGNSGAWYLRVAQFPKIKTNLPEIVIGKNIHQFLPQGEDTSRWLVVLNEVQMLLHEHPANMARESLGEVAVNSIWLSGGGMMPQVADLQGDKPTLVADDIFYQGLASWADFPLQALPKQFDVILQKYSLQKPVKHLRLSLPSSYNLNGQGLDEAWFDPILAALKIKKIKELRLNLGFYEKTLSVDIKPIDTYKFWRSLKPTMDYFT
ncbi:MAG: hypothetical protein Q8M99_03875 [Methylotenera sp.]|nr:hypothetical protein [Methylotenera sp.]